MSKRNGTRAVTGEDSNSITAVVVVATIFLAVLVVWEYTARNVLGFNANYSSPSDTVDALTTYWHADLKRMGLTALRGAFGIIIAFFVAYPLGTIIPMFGGATKSLLFLIVSLLAVPSIIIVFTILRIGGFDSNAVMTIVVWTNCLRMLAFGALHTLNLLTHKGEMGDILESAITDGANRWQLWWSMILPLNRYNHITSLYVLSGSIWTTVAFAEGQATANVSGLGERMMIMVYGGSGTLGHYFAAAFLLLVLAVSTLLVIYFLQKHSEKYD